MPIKVCCLYTFLDFSINNSIINIAKGGRSAAIEVPTRTKEKVPILSVKTQLQPSDMEPTSPTSLPTQSSTMSVHRFPSYPTFSSAAPVTVKNASPTKSATRARSLNDLLSERTTTLLPAGNDDENDKNERKHLDTTSTNPEYFLNARQPPVTPHESVTPRASSQTFLDNSPIVIPKQER